MDAKEKYGQWIPCSERLPEITHFYYDTEPFSDDVLVTLGNKWKLKRVAFGHLTEKGWVLPGEIYECDSEFSWKPIAWTPLPDPWRGENND